VIGNCIHTYGWKYEGKRSHVRRRHRWEGNTEINLIKMGFGGVNRVGPGGGLF
jgi:hypothetical protein